MKRSTTPVCLLIGVWCTFPLAASDAAIGKSTDRTYIGKDWPQWLGPAQTGVSQEKGWQPNWGPKGPKILWKKNVGTGFSAFAVANSVAYTMGNKRNQETVYAFDAKTGDEIWSFSYPGRLVNRLHEGGPSATPTIHEGRVYTLGKEGQVYCLNAATGGVKWRTNLMKELGIRRPEWGFCSSAVIFQKNVIFQSGPAIAFDRVKGKRAWVSKGYKPAYSTPLLFKQGRGTGMAVLNTWGLVIMDPRNGKELSTYSWRTSFSTNSTTPVVADGTVFVSTGYRKGCVLLKIQPGKMKQIYKNDVMSNHMNNSIPWKGHLYGFDGNTHGAADKALVCMDFKTGKEKWRAGGMGVGSLTISDGRLIILSETGKLITARASPEKFEKIAEAQVLKGRCWTMPILSHGIVYVRNAKGDAVAVDLRGR